MSAPVTVMRPSGKMMSGWPSFTALISVRVAIGLVGSSGADGVITVRPDVEGILSGWPGWVRAPSRKALADCVVTLTPRK